MPHVSQGGMLVHGMADQLPHVTATTDYYNGLVSRYGQAELDKSVRFYRIPGWGHGVGPFNVTNGGVPSLDALESWVEDGAVPTGLGTFEANAGKVYLSRPLCAYPTYPEYKCTGDANVATSFECSPE